VVKPIGRKAECRKSARSVLTKEQCRAYTLAENKLGETSELRSLTSSRAIGRRLFETIDASFKRLEPPAASDKDRRCTKRIENRCAINARVGFPLLPVLQVMFRKVRRFGSRKEP
jgi:hypothetical protein